MPCFGMTRKLKGRAYIKSMLALHREREYSLSNYAALLIHSFTLWHMKFYSYNVGQNTVIDTQPISWKLQEAAPYLLNAGYP